MSYCYQFVLWLGRMCTVHLLLSHLSKTWIGDHYVEFFSNSLCVICCSKLKNHMVENFKNTGSGITGKSLWRSQNNQMLENIRAVRQSTVKSPKCSAFKHASVLGLSNHSVRRIVHISIRLHPYKMMVVHNLKDHDPGNRMACSEHIPLSDCANGVLLSSL